MTSAPQSYAAAKAFEDSTQLRQSKAEPPSTPQVSSHNRHSPPYIKATPMAQVVEPTHLPDEEATKLIQEFAEWLGTTNTKNSREWEERADGIYVCIHLRCEEKILTLKEKLVCPK